MTAQEAIKDLQEYAEYSWGDLNETFKMAIEALENLNKLKEYETLEEQGLLLHLPCKLGTPVYLATTMRDCTWNKINDLLKVKDYFTPCDKDEDTPAPLICSQSECPYWQQVPYVHPLHFTVDMRDEINKTIFFSPEAAWNHINRCSSHD